MYDKANVNVLNDIMSEYYADVTEYSYNESKSIFDAKSRVVTSKKAPAIVATQEDAPATTFGVKRSDANIENQGSMSNSDYMVKLNNDLDNKQQATETSETPADKGVLKVGRYDVKGGYGINTEFIHKDKGKLKVVEINDKDQPIAEDEAGNRFTLSITK